MQTGSPGGVETKRSSFVSLSFVCVYLCFRLDELDEKILCTNLCGGERGARTCLQQTFQHVLIYCLSGIRVTCRCGRVQVALDDYDVTNLL
jgi:hypothetical protein